MNALGLSFRIALVVGMMLGAAMLAIVGQRRLARSRTRIRSRASEIAPFVLVFLAVLFANRVARSVGPDLSWLFGANISWHLQRFDGAILQPVFGAEAPQFVAYLQSFASPGLTAFFGFSYVYGYVFLCSFPLLAYFLHDRPEPLKRTIVAYGANYLIGVACYVLFIAYGPRNIVSNSVDQLLYVAYPEYQFLTYSINTPVNVFPSLHASLAITVAMLAWTTRREFPGWVPVAAVLAGSVTVATMYLGIHWAGDVIAGFALAWVSVRIGRRYEDRSPDLGCYVPGAVTRVLAR